MSPLELSLPRRRFLQASAAWLPYGLAGDEPSPRAVHDHDGAEDVGQGGEEGLHRDPADAERREARRIPQLPPRIGGREPAADLQEGIHHAVLQPMLPLQEPLVALREDDERRLGVRDLHGQDRQVVHRAPQQTRIPCRQRPGFHAHTFPGHGDRCQSAGPSTVFWL